MTAPIQEPYVGLIIDTSGSMASYEYALGPIAWILTDELRQIGGRCATALFGNGATLLAGGTKPLPLVPGIRTVSFPFSLDTRGPVLRSIRSRRRDGFEGSVDELAARRELRGKARERPALKSRPWLTPGDPPSGFRDRLPE